MNDRDVASLTWERLTAVFIKLFLAAGFSLAISQLILILNALPLQPVWHGFFTLLILGILAALTWQRYSLIFTGLLSIMAALTGLLLRESLQETWLEREPELISFFNWSGRWILGQREANADYEARLALLLVAGLALLSYLLLARFNRPLIALAVWTTILFLLQDPFQPQRMLWLILAAVILFAAYARKQRRSYKILQERRFVMQSRLMLQALPVALAALLLASWLAPPLTTDVFRSARINRLIDDVGQRIPGPFRTRSPYRFVGIDESGYHPLENRLGGPVTLSSEPVFDVRGHAESMHLRGKILARYDGTRWHRDPEAELLPLNDVFAASAREAFGLEGHVRAFDRVDASDLFESVEYQIQPQYRPMRTVFLAGRPTDISVEIGNQAFYFDRNGEVYTQDWVQDDDAIQLSVYLPRLDDSDFISLLGWLEQESDLASDYARQDRFLQLPDLVEYEPGGAVYELSNSLTWEGADTYPLALAMRDHLRAFGRYELDVPAPPAQQEFVSHFLETGEGYCVYFATALTMLLRLQDIPARYVEGFFAPASSDPAGLRTITGENAHAWTEVYVPDVGWIPVDATPSGNVFDRPPEDREELPVATPTVPELADLTPSPFPDAQDPAETIETQDPNAQSPFRLNLRWLSYALLAALAVAYVLRAVHVYRHRQDLDWLQEKIADPTELAGWYRVQLGRLLADLGLKKRPNESLRGWFARLENESDWFAGREKLVADMLLGLEIACYGDQPPASKQLQALAQTYRLLETIVRQNQNPILFILKRVLRPSTLFIRF